MFNDRRKPITKLDVIGNLDLSPEECLGDLIESRQTETIAVKSPTWGVPDSIELLAIKNDREFMEMLQVQEEMLENARKSRRANSRRIAEVYKVQNELRERFVSTNAFIQDCEGKRKIGEKKLKEQYRIQEKLKEEIEVCTVDIKELSQFRDVLVKTVKQFAPYETVIEQVVKKSDIMNTVKDCIDRCDALMLAQVEITEMEQEKIKNIEDIRHHMVKATNDAAMTVLGLNNELAELERSYNHARAETFKWEKIMANTKDCISNNELARDRALDAISQMYKLLCKRKEIDAVLKRECVEEQLDIIRNEIDILRNVVGLCKKKIKGAKD